MGINLPQVEYPLDYTAGYSFVQTATAVAAHSSNSGDFFMTDSFPLKEGIDAITVIPTTPFMIMLILLPNLEVSVTNL